MKRHFHYQKGNVSKYSRKREGFEMSDMSNVFILDHPLIQHKISRLRDENTGTNEFRKLIEEIAMLMGYEALRDLPMEDVEIKTPIETCKTPMIAGKKMAIVPILRAGLGMVGGMMAANGKSGFLGALLAGFAAGYIILGLRKLCDKLPEALEKIAPVLIYPVVGILIIGLLMTFIVEPVMGGINTGLNNALTGMGSSSKVVLGIVLGGMMAIDMGGPFNKAA